MEQNSSAKYRQCAEIYGRITSRYLDLDLALSTMQIELALQRFSELSHRVEELIVACLPNGNAVCRPTEFEQRDHLARAKAEVARISIRKPSAPASDELELLMSQLNELVSSFLHGDPEVRITLERSEKTLETVSYLKAYIEAAKA